MKRLMLLVVTVMFGASTWAQNLIFVDADGNEIKSGTTLNMNTVEDDGWGSYQIPLKGVSIKNTSLATQSFSMTANVTALPSETSFQCCFGMNCRIQDKTGVMNLDALSIDGGETKAISNTEWMMGETENEGACTVVLTITGGPSITINFDKNLTNTAETEASDDIVTLSYPNMRSGKPGSITINLKTEKNEYSAYNFFIYVPKGMTFPTKSAKKYTDGSVINNESVGISYSWGVYPGDLGELDGYDCYKLAAYDSGNLCFNSSAGGSLVTINYTGGTFEPKPIILNTIILARPIGTKNVIDKVIGPDIRNTAVNIRFKTFESTNTTASSTSSKTYTFSAVAGDNLSFDWSVSSEDESDYLTITLDGTEIVKQSGVQSGTYNEDIASDGTHTLVATYSKDGSKSMNDDKAIVSNITIENYVSPRTTETYEDWTSDNAGKGDTTSEKTYTITASEGDVVSCDWTCDSEEEGDYMYILWDGKTSLTQTGRNLSGTYTKTVDEAGTHTLTIQYTKDASKDRGEDKAGVTNVKLTYATPKSELKQMYLQDEIDSINVAEEFGAEAFTYARTFSNTAWQALYVPFSMSYNDWSTDFDVARIVGVHNYDRDDDGTIDDVVVEIAKVKSGSLKANYPYLIRTKATGSKTISLSNVTMVPTEGTTIDCSTIDTKYNFCGTYSQLSKDELNTLSAKCLSSGSLVTSTSALNAMRWYLTTEDRNAESARKIQIRLWDNEEELSDPTGIESFGTDNTVVPVCWFTTDGARHAEPQKGVNMVKYSDGSVKKVVFE